MEHSEKLANQYDLDFDMKEWKAILDSTQDAIFIDDMNGNTQWINKACEQLYEIKRVDIIGKNIDELEKEGIFSPSVAKNTDNRYTPVG
jgi:PAS domain S-box-containing protein